MREDTKFKPGRQSVKKISPGSLQNIIGGMYISFAHCIPVHGSDPDPDTMLIRSELNTQITVFARHCITVHFSDPDLMLISSELHTQSTVFAIS